MALARKLPGSIWKVGCRTVQKSDSSPGSRPNALGTTSRISLEPLLHRLPEKHLSVSPATPIRERDPPNIRQGRIEARASTNHSLRGDKTVMIAFHDPIQWDGQDKIAPCFDRISFKREGRRLPMP